MQMSGDNVQKRKESPYMASHVTMTKRVAYINNEMQLKIIL